MKKGVNKDMKKMIMRLVWQAIGFLGSIIILCSASFHQHDFYGITGIMGSILGLELFIPLVICIVLFILGGILCYKGLNEK